MLNPADRTPLYLQVAQLLRQRIVGGEYSQGDTLPGEDALMTAYGVSRYTARQAVGVLREEGLVLTRRGAGSVVRSVPPKIQVQAGPDDVITTRMPTPAERAMLGVAEGVPVLSVKRPGRPEELFDGNRAEVMLVR